MFILNDHQKEILRYYDPVGLPIEKVNIKVLMPWVLGSEVDLDNNDIYCAIKEEMGKSRKRGNQ